MSEQSLEQQQRDYDAWMKSMEEPANKPRVLATKKSAIEPALQKTKKKEFSSSGYVTFLQLLAVVSLLAGAVMLAESAPAGTKAVIVISAFFTGIGWLVAAHALRLLEEIHWKSKQD